MAEYKKRPNPINIKLPDLRHDSEDKHKERDLTDPPLLKKGNLKMHTHKEEEKSDKFGKLTDIFEKTQT